MFHAEATFEVTLWEQHKPAEGEPTPTFVPVTVLKIFKGDIEGRSEARLVMTGYPNDAGAYVAVEHIEARIGERNGTFAVHHCATNGGPKPEARWTIVSGSGTGDFEGMIGSATYRHDDAGAHFTLDYEFAT